MKKTSAILWLLGNGRACSHPAMQTGLHCFRFIAALVLPMMLGLYSCSDTDNPVEPVNPTPSEDITLDEMNSVLTASPYVDISYYMMEENTIRVWAFSEDKTFVAYDLFFDDEDGSFQVEENTGQWSAFIDGKNEWEEDNTDKLIGFDAVYDEYGDVFSEESRSERFYALPVPDGEDDEDETMFFLSRQALNYLYAAFLEENQKNESGARGLTRATAAGSTPSEAISTIGNATGTVTYQDLASKEALEALYRQTMAGLNAAGRTEAGYNINAKTFTRDNWREQKYIYRYTGDGNQVDENGSAGYTREALPWADGVAVSTHLPFNFCDDLQPANGWELVFNAIGEYDVKNRDFFAVYNKFTGLLRFFVYLPNLNVADANDHAWEVTLSQQLAHRLNYKFGIPMSQNIVNKEPLGLRGTDYGYIVSPWVDSKTDDGFAPPGGGWWAFDVDLSQYRPDFQTLKENIRLEMRVWSNSQVSLRSKINAEIKEKAPAEESMTSSLGGLVSKAKSATGDVTNLIANFTSGNWVGAIKSTVAAAKGAWNIISDARNLQAKFYGQTPPQPEYIVKQYIDGTIDTEGLIKGSRTVSGMNTITYAMSQFDVNNSTVGQGVWNLKTPPTLICLGQFNYIDPHKMSGLTDLFPQYGNTNIGLHYTLDPRSIDVVLNPNVFPKDQIEWKRVTAVCGVRKDTKHDTYNAYRNAIGMSNNDAGDTNNLASFNNHASNSPCYDYLYDADDKQGLAFPKCWENVETYTESSRKGEAPHHLVGRGDDGYLLEPTQFSSSKWEDLYSDPRVSISREVLSPRWIPSYEVTVTVTVKLKDYDTPFVMTRAYLPNYTFYTQDDVNHRLKEEHDKLDKWLADQKADPTNKTEWQEYQVQHIKSQFNAIFPNYEAVQTAKFWLFRPKGWAATGGHGGEIADHLFDHNPATKWFSNPYQKTNDCWIVDFASNVPCTVKSYTLTAPADVESHPGRNPREWSLYGKKNASDPEWALLDYRFVNVNAGDAMPTVNSATKIYDIKFPGEYSVYRLAVKQTMDSFTFFNTMGQSCYLSISCLDFNF